VLLEPRHPGTGIGENSRDHGVIAATIGHGERHGVPANADAQFPGTGSVQSGVGDKLGDR
jgi:hypothetical protein